MLGERLDILCYVVDATTQKLGLLLGWLARTKPNAVALQEPKIPTADSPRREHKGAGYESLWEVRGACLSTLTECRAIRRGTKFRQVCR